MNERIQELAEQANDHARKYVADCKHYGYYMEHNEYDLQFQEKFAELIVRECAQIATEQGNTAEHSFTAIRAKWFRLGAIKSATMIKRTFGVEE